MKELFLFDYDSITLFLTSDFSESKSKKAEKMSATTSTQTPTTVRSGDASSGSSVVAKKSAVVSAADSIANKSQKGIVVGNGEVNGVSAMKEKKINLKVAAVKVTSMIQHHVSDIRTG